MKRLMLIFLLFISGADVHAEIYDSPFHNRQVYSENADILKRIISRGQHRTADIETLVKYLYALESFKEVIQWSGRIKPSERSTEVLYMRASSYAALSEYASAAGELEELIRHRGTGRSDAARIREQIGILHSSLPTSGRPEFSRPHPDGSGLTPVGRIDMKSLTILADRARSRFIIWDDRGKEVKELPPALYGLSPSSLEYLSVSADGRELLASVRGEDSAEILYARRSSADEKPDWVSPFILNLGTVNTSAHFMPDGIHAVFTSSRGFGGGLDIYSVRRDEDGDWSDVRRIEGANTPHDEPSVFIHPDGETLYFSSGGLPGQGGFDLFTARLLKKGLSFKTADIRPLKPFNTWRNEARVPVIPADSSQTYLAFTVNGRDSVYSGLPRGYMPAPVALVNIRTADASSKEPLTAMVKVIGGDRPESDPAVYINITDNQGNARFALERGRQYTITLWSQGFLYESLELNVPHGADRVDRSCYLRKGAIKSGYSFLADRIYFDTGSYSIRRESQPELERLYDFLHKNRGLDVIISGYTDNVGGYEYNMKLSRKRAEAIAGYLKKRGISRWRIETEGFGYTRSIAPNTTEEERRKNRRVEITVTSSE